MVEINWKDVKKANSKKDLVEHIRLCHLALDWYTLRQNWAKRDDEILWLGDEDPTYAAAVTLGKRKKDPNYRNQFQKAKEAREKHGRESQVDPENRGGNEILEREHQGDASSRVREG